MLFERLGLATSIPVLLGLAAALALTPGCGKKDDAGGQGQAGGQRPGGGPGGRPATPAIPVAVRAAETGPIASYYTATATLEADKQAEVLARVSGVVLRIPAEEGDRVQRGQELLRVEDTEYGYRVKQAEAEYQKQTTRYERLKKMHEGNLVSAEEYDTALNDFQAAEASLDLARLDFSYTSVKAPFAGRIVTRHVDPGQTVNVGTALFSIADLSRLLAPVYVPAKEFRRLQPNQAVDLALDSDARRLTGRIHLVSPVIDPSSGTIKVTVEVPDYPVGTRPGDFAQVSIVTEQHENAVLVPKVAVVTDKGDQVVYVAADSTAERRVVEVGFQDDRNAEILSGLAAGEPVVVQGQRSLKHGAAIKLMEPMKFEGADADTAAAPARSDAS